MDLLLNNLAVGFSGAATLENVGYAFIGCLLGTLVGVLPGIGVVPTVAMLLPLTFGIDPLSGLIMLAGIYYGAQYGGSTAAILVRMPGEAGSIVTTLDGYEMARKNRGGAALAIAALASFFAGTVATLLIAAFGSSLADVAMHFHSADYFSLMVLGLTMSIVLAQGSILKAITVMLIGFLFGLIGLDLNSGVQRFTFDMPDLYEGVSFLAISIGLFGLVEVVRNLEFPEVCGEKPTMGIRDLYPTKEELRDAAPATVRGTVLGSMLGILPGGGAVLASFASYTLEKKLSKKPETFGHGAPAGVAAPEAANNAGAQTSFIPLLTLGLPSNPIMALLMGAMMIHGVAPGSAIISERPELFWGLIASMWIGNLMLVVLNLPLVGLWVKLLTISYRMLFPAIMMFCLIGVYSEGGSAFQVLLLGGFTLFGYLLMRCGCEPAPLILGFILGPMMEENLRRALNVSGGDYSIFIDRPISASLLGAAVVLLVVMSLPGLRKKRAKVFED
ncbi:MAG TPA: tripartite tricarboxylate transporter permease [Rhizobiaceae bacterium]|nr:tripartite tricarboxylate transporter permease [Rhizobiaceae bacterium]